MGGNYHAKACGANDVLVAYRDALGEEVKPVTHYDTGVYGINILFDLTTLLGLMHRSQIPQNQSNNILPYLSKKVWSRLSKDDIIPFIKSTQAFLTRK